MTNVKFNLRTRGWETGFAFVLVLLFAYIWLRHAGAYPSVFADEQIYSHFARLVPLKDVTIPSYLYFWTFGLTNACGDGFLGCARFLNMLFFVGSAPFIYMATRLVAPKPAAMLAAVLCIAAPTSTFTAYFMPESMYFFGFAVLTWLCLARPSRHWVANAMVPGMVLGLMTLVKVHALFLVPALALFALYMEWSVRRNATGLAYGLAAAILSVAGVFMAKFSLGYLFVGPEALQILGSFYGKQASDGVSSGATLLTLLPAAWFSLKGHLLMLAMIYALPIAVFIHHALSREAREEAGPQTSALMVYTLLMLGAALGLTVFYTASTAGYGPLDGKRLHARYYTFALMLPVMIAAARTGVAWRRSKAVLPWVLAALLAVAIAYGAIALPAGYIFLLADGAEITALGLGKPATWAVAVLAAQAAVLAVWALNRKAGAFAWLLVFMPLYLLNGERMISEFTQRATHSSAWDSAGRYAHDHLTPAQRNEVRIVGDNHGELLRARFHVDAPGVDTMVLPAGWEIEPYSLPGRKGWLLVIGDYKLPAGVTPAYKNGQFSLVPLSTGNRFVGEAKFNGPLDNGVLADAEGLAGPEGFGRWSNDDQVKLHFKEALPKRFNLFMTMQAFGPNEGKEFVVRVGGAEQRIKLAPLPHEVYLNFETDGMQKTVEIDVPQAVSPKELGMSEDIRRLGLGITRVEIGVPAK